MLVRKNKVVKALEWLKLNHIDYADLNISYDNLAAYPENEPLKSIQQVFELNTQLLSSGLDTKDKARSIITKIVNVLIAALKIGGPIATMYFLKHPDHYTNHQFRTCY